MNKQMAVHWCHHPLPHSPTEPEGCVCLPGLILLEGDLDPAAARVSIVFIRYDKTYLNEKIRQSQGALFLLTLSLLLILSSLNTTQVNKNTAETVLPVCRMDDNYFCDLFYC